MDEMGRDDLERKLDGYFGAERADLRAPDDLWANVSARLGEQDPVPLWRRMFGGMAAHGMGRVYYAGAAAAVTGAVIGAVMFATIVGTGGSGDKALQSMASDVQSSSAQAPAIMAANRGLPTAPESAAAPAAAVTSAPAEPMAPTPAVMADAVPRAPTGLTQNASAAALEEELPFRNEVWGLLNGSRTHLFWVALPRGWESGAPAFNDGVWTGVLSGPGVTLEYSFGEREMTESLRATTFSAAGAQQQRMWDEYVIGNLAFMVAPPEGSVGDLRMTLQLPSGTLRFSGEALGPFQQELALVVFRSIIT